MWNVDDAFIGTIQSPSTVNPAFSFSSFLVVPLLLIDGVKYVQKKFCGNIGGILNDCEISMALNAFLHFVFLDSKKTLLFADIQGDRVLEYRE